VPSVAWASTSVDFITQLPNSAGYTQIMVVVDRFTKMAHFIGLQENATAKEVAEAFLKEVCKLQGLPSEIITDMDAKFAGEFWESLYKRLGVKGENIDRLSSPNQWRNGKSQSSMGRVPSNICQLRSG